MNIRWSPTLRRFEAEFTSFAEDYAAVRRAKFKTDGPPEWLWWTQSVKVLNALRANKPESGLTITPEALEVYKPMALMEEKNQEVRKQFDKTKKKVRRAKNVPEIDPTCLVSSIEFPEGKWWIGFEDLKPRKPFVSEFPPQAPPPALLCVSCAQPVYFYENTEDKICLFCEKELDNVFGV